MPYMIGQRVITLSVNGREITGTINCLERETAHSPITDCRIYLDEANEEAKWGEIWRPISKVRAVPVFVAH